MQLTISPEFTATKSIESNIFTALWPKKMVWTRSQAQRLPTWFSGFRKSNTRGNRLLIKSTAALIGENIYSLLNFTQIKLKWFLRRAYQTRRVQVQRTIDVEVFIPINHPYKIQPSIFLTRHTVTLLPAILHLMD